MTAAAETPMAKGGARRPNPVRKALAAIGRRAISLVRPFIELSGLATAVLWHLGVQPVLEQNFKTAGLQQRQQLAQHVTNTALLTATYQAHCLEG